MLLDDSIEHRGYRENRLIMEMRKLRHTLHTRAGIIACLVSRWILFEVGLKSYGGNFRRKLRRGIQIGKRASG
jgi:hypothetical protein